MVETTTTARPKAYSYLRFSTPEQREGDSFRRQSTMAIAYALRNGLDLDQTLTFHDLGVSAFKGANAETGRLADFLEAVKVGHVPPGSFLLVEALDRLSRSVPRRATKVLESIVDAGVTVVTLNDEKAYTSESLDRDPIDFIVAMLLFMRGNEESATKARRLKAAWHGKRLIAATTPLTACVPAWIRLDRKAGKLVLIPERAAVVVRIFAEYLSGHGQHAITAGLNSDGEPCFGRAKFWYRSYISKILSSPSVHGVYLPHEYSHEGHKRVRRPLDPLPGYYPPAVSLETFEDAQRMGGTAHRVKSRAGQVVNLFGGLATCPLCASTMTRVNKGARSTPKLVCTNAKAGGGCAYRGVDLATVEAGLLANLGQFIGDAPSGVEGLDDELAGMDTNVSVYRDLIENLVQALSKGASAAVTQKLSELELELSDLQGIRAALLDRIASGSSPVLAKRLRDLEAALSATPLDRPKANALMRSMLASVVVDYPHGLLHFHWKHAGETSLTYAWPEAV